MPRKPNHTCSGTDQYLIDHLPREFWTLMRCMLPMHGPTLTELRKLNWCEAVALCCELGADGFPPFAPWSLVEQRCQHLISNRQLHLGHVLALLKARTRPPC